MRRILAQTRKELTQIIRDRMALALALFLPVMQLILMGSAISLDVKDLPIAVQDLDDTPASHDFVDAFRQSISFHVVPFSLDRQPENAFLENQARAVLIVPEHFERDIARGLERGERRSGASGAGHGGYSVLVQSRAIVEKILRAGHIRPRHVFVPAVAGDPGYVEGGRAEDDSAGLCIEHLGT